MRTSTNAGGTSSDGRADAHAPIAFSARVGDNLSIYVDTYDQACRPPTLWLYSVRLGQVREHTEWRSLSTALTSDGCPAVAAGWTGADGDTTRVEEGRRTASY